MSDRKIAIDLSKVAGPEFREFVRRAMLKKKPKE